MELIQKTIRHSSKGDCFNIYAIGDIHEGNIGCNIEKLKNDNEIDVTI